MRDRPVVGEQGKLSPIPGPQPNSSPNDITASSSPAFSIPAAVALPRENDSVSPAAQGIPAETAPPADKEDDVSSVSLSPNPPRSETTSIEANSGEPGRITARLQAPPDLTMPNPSESPQPIAVTPIPELPRESATDPVAKIASSDAPPPQNLAAEAKPPEATRPAPHGSPQQNQSAQDAASGRSSTPEPSPSSSGVKPREYTVQEGDTLFDIAQQELGAAKHWPRIYRLNRDRLGDNFGLLPVGLKLAIPTETPAPLTR
jgi:nucleoid-associated protein YgaU